MGTMKTVEKIVNPRERAGEKSPGKIYTDKLKVRRRREWRGVRILSMITPAGFT